MNITRAIAAAGAVLLVAATAGACGSSEPAPRVTVTTTQTVTAAPSSPPAQDEGVALKMGTEQTLQDDQGVTFTVQALEYQQPFKGPQPEKPDASLGGDTWATVKAKVCDGSGGPLIVDQSVWSLSYADGTSIATTGLNGGDMPKPEFPVEKTLSPGRCAAGLISFPVPGKKTPDRISYELGGSSPIEWAVRK
ncbi:DUF4352 domain-containing protein [Streptomyces seoulensis]|uniref:DUF4352 domain-containing protein n=1 Tax=Streptomyces seoulensis TaxID=73044 RepID=UPI001F1AEA89|nr:DUF4352 domain-containing protein [Streptomyces seoulensis]